jgi:hypothetical protein
MCWAELTEMLADRDLPYRLMEASQNLKADPDFQDRLDLLIMQLEFLLDVAKSRLCEPKL